MAIGDDTQNEDAPRKPGLFGRLFGRGREEPKPAPAETPAIVAHAETPPALELPIGSASGAAPEPEPTSTATPQPAPVPVAEAVVSAEGPGPVEKLGWWQRLTKGLARSSSTISRSLTEVFTKRRLDAAMLDDLEDILIQADLGVGTAQRIREAVAKGRYDKDVDPQEVKQVLAAEVEAVLTPVARAFEIDATHKPYVVLVVGVNGSGKTTTIGKLAAKLNADGHKLLLAAGDTFRAAAIEQLQIWGQRVGASVVARDQGADPAGLAFDAIKQAKDEGADVVLMDTAGRLQNRAELMAELEKVVRVMKKVDETAPHAVLLVLDATIGQNAISQVEIFGRTAGVTGLVMTKLDGTARGGILVAIADRFKLPVHYIGVGEGVDDLEPFEARDFARAIAGLDERA